MNLNRDELIKKWQHVLDKTAGVFTFTSGHELAFLCEMASESKSVCEIGSYHGRSALCMALANPGCKILCIDQPESEEAWGKLTANLAPFVESGQVKVIRGDSKALENMDEFLCFGFAFVDAGHLYHDVLRDIMRLRPHMANGGLLSGHDWREHDFNDGVNRAVLDSFPKDQINVFESIWTVQIP